MEYLTVHLVPRVDGDWAVSINRLSTRAVMGPPKRMAQLPTVVLPQLHGADLAEAVAFLVSALRPQRQEGGKSWTDEPLPGL